MMKKIVKLFKRAFAVVFVALFSLAMALPTVMGQVNASASAGLRFSSEDDYQMTTLLSQTPMSYESSFKITAEEAAMGEGFIFSNHSAPQSGAIFNLRVTAKGVPLLYLRQNGSTYNYYISFSKVNVATGNKVHLAVTTDGESFYCYVDGVLKQTIARDTAGTQSVDFGYSVKVKVRLGNQTIDDSKYFKGELYSLAMFSDVRTAAEIVDDASSLNTQDTNLMAAYDFTNVTEGQLSFSDLSGKGNTISAPKKTWKWSTTSPYNPDDYAFSFMLVGDTQIVSKQSIIDLADGKIQANNTYMDQIYDYIVDVAEEKNVKHVFGLGDVTEYNSKNEWAEAVRVTSKMKGVVPYSVIPGNHDGATNWWANSCLKNNAGYAGYEPYFIYDYVGGGEGSPKNGTVDTAKGDTYYTQYFGVDSPYASEWADYYVSAKSVNTVHFFTGSDRLEYMVLALEYGPTDDVLNWASNVIEQYPNHNVIITTHGYMTESGEYLVRNNTNGAAANTGMLPTAGPNGASSNCGDEMWNELVKKHRNIKMLFCGHVDNDTIIYRQDKGTNGNLVTQMLCNPQGIDIKNVSQPLIAEKGDTAANRLVGMVATYYVSKDGKTIDVEWYSPIQKAYYLEEGQFTFTTEATAYPRVVARVKGGNGTVDPATQEITSGRSVVVNFQPDYGYEIKNVTFDGRDFTAYVIDNKLDISLLSGYHEIEVEYQERSGIYTLNLNNDDAKGEVAYKTVTYPTYAEGERVKFTVTPKEGYEIAEVKCNGQTITAENGVYVAVMAATDNVIEVVYAEKVYTYGITVVNDAAKGTVKAQRPLSVEYVSGTKIAFSIQLIGDNSVETVTFNGQTLEAVDGTYTLTVEAKDNVLEVVYKAPVVEEDSSSSSEEIVDSNSESSTSMSCFSGIQGAGMMLGALACSALAMFRKKEDNE